MNESQNRIKIGLTPMECLQARLDYAHHTKKAGMKKGSHDDDKALTTAASRETLKSAMDLLETRRDHADTGTEQLIYQDVILEIQQALQSLAEGENVEKEVEK